MALRATHLDLPPDRSRRKVPKITPRSGNQNLEPSARGLKATEHIHARTYPCRAFAPEPPKVTCYAGLEQLNDFLRNSDILVGLLPETPLTRGLLSASRLAMLPKNAGIVSAGRGSLIVMPDLIAALDSGHLYGAVLDVFENEPLPASDPVWDHPRTIVTGHIAGFASRYARAEYVADAIKAWRSGEPLPNLYQPSRGY